MLVPVLLFLLGLALLIKGGDWFVDGAVGIAHRFGLPEILIGATIVSIGTTLPEVMVSSASAVSGHGEIAYGNAVGSVICNTALIAALTVAIKPAKAERKTLIQPILFFFGAAAIYLVNAYLFGGFSRLSGILLLLVFAAYIVMNVIQAKKALLANRLPAETPEEEKKEEEPDKKPSPLWKDIVLIVIGAALVAVGARLLVDNGTKIASALGVPESVIALTFVALGTSLPELVTAIVSLAKGHGALSLGNVIGANLFNLVLVNGVSVVLSPFAVPVEKTVGGMNASLVVDLPLMMGVMLLLTVPALVKQKLYRWQGILLLIIYAAFCAFQFLS